MEKTNFDKLFNKINNYKKIIATEEFGSIFNKVLGGMSEHILTQILSDLRYNFNLKKYGFKKVENINDITQRVLSDRTKTYCPSTLFNNMLDPRANYQPYPDFASGIENNIYLKLVNLDDFSLYCKDSSSEKYNEKLIQFVTDNVEYIWIFNFNGETHYIQGYYNYSSKEIKEFTGFKTLTKGLVESEKKGSKVTEENINDFQDTSASSHSPPSKHLTKPVSDSVLHYRRVNQTTFHMNNHVCLINALICLPVLNIKYS